MLGLMQDWPLRVSSIIDHAAKYHTDRPIVGRSVEGPVTRTTWGQVRTRALKLAQALARLGVKPGEVVGCMAWNTAPTVVQASGRHAMVANSVPGTAASKGPSQGASTTPASPAPNSAMNCHTARQTALSARQ